MPSTSSRHLPTIRIPPPRMQAFAVPSNLNSADDPMHGAKRKQIETRQRQLDSLKKIGKKQVLKKYDLFTLNTSCFWGSTGSNITHVQFHEIFVAKYIE